MIYDEPIIRPLGDCYLAVEFGDEANLELNFRVLALAALIEQEKIGGVCEVIPSFRELAVTFDREATSHARLGEALSSMLDSLSEVQSLYSRVVRLPCWYDDPWSTELARRYGVQNNLEFVAEHNGITVPEVIELHSQTDWWVVCLGFAPASFFAYALEPRSRLIAPKWRIPRDFTPARAMVLGGFSCGVHPVAGPGGYQLLGRVAVNTYERVPRNACFPEDGVLCRATDRIRYLPINALEYDEIWAQCQAGEYDYDIREEQFDIGSYLDQQAVSR